MNEYQYEYEQELNNQVEVTDFSDDISDDALDRTKIAQFYCYALPTAVIP